jgi:Ser/Thr protein kinase RdoA (MazF antagonist)
LLRRGLHDTYLVVNGATRYIVRAYRSGVRSSEEVAYELEALTHLVTRRVRVSSPIPDAHGQVVQLLAAPEGSRPLALFSYAPGVRLAWTEAESRLAGGLLAEIHLASAAFAPVHSRAGRDLESLVDRPLVEIGRFLKHRPQDWSLLTDVAVRIRAGVTAVADALEWGFCHGDYGAKNIHVDAAGHLTAFDFDRCGPGWRAGDFALVKWAAVGRRRPEMWTAFVEGYRERRPIANVDVEAVPLFYALALVSAMGVLASNVDTWGTARVDNAALDGWLTSLRTWEAQHASGWQP